MPERVQYPTAPRVTAQVVAAGIVHAIGPGSGSLTSPSPRPRRQVLIHSHAPRCVALPGKRNDWDCRSDQLPKLKPEPKKPQTPDGDAMMVLGYRGGLESSDGSIWSCFLVMLRGGCAGG